MRFGEFKSIGHNIADSLASGICFMIGVYDVDVFREAMASEGHVIGVDFLSGRVTAGDASEKLAGAVRAYAEALPELCDRHGTTADAFARLEVCFEWSPSRPRRFTVDVEDRTGRRSVDTYVGVPGRRPLMRDDTGRVRRDPGIRLDRTP